MGQLVDGTWIADDEALRHAQGRFLRPPSRFRSWVTADGAAGPSGSGGFAAERGRYHL
jgi:putative glutathione S-transferase